MLTQKLHFPSFLDAANRYLEKDFQNTAVSLAVDSYQAYSSEGNCTTCKLRIRRNDGDAASRRGPAPCPILGLTLLLRSLSPHLKIVGLYLSGANRKTQFIFSTSTKGMCLGKDSDARQTSPRGYCTIKPYRLLHRVPGRSLLYEWKLQKTCNFCWHYHQRQGGKINPSPCHSVEL